MKKKVAILGAGFTGLTVAYILTKRKDIEVYLFEKEEKPGGLAVGFKHKGWQWTVEATYHHLFTSDHFAKKLALDFDIPVIFKRPITASYAHNTIVPLDSPLSLLSYPYLSLWDKTRTSLVLAFLRLTPFWKPLERETAKNWLVRMQGLNSWRELWEPLFVGKFGNCADKIAASWFWARIKKRSSSLGYIEGGFQRLTNELSDRIRNQGGKVYLSTEISEIKYDGDKWVLKAKRNNSVRQLDGLNFEFIISTLPTPVFIKVNPQLPDEYIKKLSSISHLYALNLFLELKKPFLPSLKNKSPYWLNIHDTSFPFLAVVEHTNFMDKKYYGGNHLLYVGNYLPQNHKFLKMSAKQLFNIFKPYLLKINPTYNLQPTTYNLFISPFAQPVIPTNYSRLRPALTTPLPNLFLGNLDCVYPWDRGINYAIELGQKLVNCVKIFL